MPIDDVAVSRSIIEPYSKKLLAGLQVDVALVGAGPADTGERYLRSDLIEG